MEDCRIPGCTDRKKQRREVIRIPMNCFIFIMNFLKQKQVYSRIIIIIMVLTVSNRPYKDMW